MLSGNTINVYICIHMYMCALGCMLCENINTC